MFDIQHHGFCAAARGVPRWIAVAEICAHVARRQEAPAPNLANPKLYRDEPLELVKQR